MKATVKRLDAHYEVTFARPAFSRVGSFAQIIEPIHDALSTETEIPADAIKFENGNTIASATVLVTLFSGNGIFEARLDGYKTHFFDLRTPNDVDRAKQCAELFERASSEFLSDARPGLWKLVLSSWLTVDGGTEAAEKLLRSLTWLPGNDDPFAIGATKTLSHVKFECFNTDRSWAVGVTVDRSALREANLFLEIATEYTPDAEFDSFEKKVQHILSTSGLVSTKLGLMLE